MQPVKFFAFLVFTLFLVSDLSGQVQLGSTIQDPDSIARIGWTIEFSHDGQRMVVGAPNASTIDWLAGKVLVYDLVDGEWVQVGQTLFGQQSNDYFGTYLSMSADGSRFAVGVRNVGNMDIPGQIITYELQNGQWDTLGQILTVGTEDWAGASVQLSADGNRLAAFVEDENEEDVVQAYEFDGETWQPLAAPIMAGSSFRFQSAMVMSADGGTLAVNGTDNSNFWRFKVYRLQGEQWVQLGSTVASSGDWDLFAWSMSLSSDGNRIAVGSPGANDNGADSGNATVWEFTDGDWQQVGSNIAGESIRDETGYSVSLAGNGQRLVVGDRYYDEPDFNSGRVRVFEWVEDDWQQVGMSFIGEDRADFFGMEVVISEDGSTVGVGAPQAGEDTPGQVKVFGDYPWEPVVSVAEITAQVQIFPNPVQDYLFIDAPTGSSWQLYSLLGNKLASGKIDGQAVDLTSLPAGIYFIDLRIGQTRISKKLLKQ